MSEIIRSCCHVVADMTMKLFEQVKIGSKYVFMPFDQRILWLRESETLFTLRHSGVLVKEMGTFNDFYGYLTSIESAITDDIPRWMETFKIQPGDKLSLCAEVAIGDRPVMVDESREGIENNSKYRKQYLAVPSYNNGGKWWYKTDKCEEGKANPPRLETVSVFPRTIIYATSPGVAVIHDMNVWIAGQRKAAGVQA